MATVEVHNLSIRFTFIQGLLKIWTEHSHWFLLNQKPLEISQQKFQHFYNLGGNELSPNLEGVAQKMDPLRPFQFWTSQGRGSLLRWAMPFIFGTERVPIEVNKWWKFNIDISNHFWEIQILTFSLSIHPKIGTKIIFKNYFIPIWEWIEETKC